MKKIFATIFLVVSIVLNTSYAVTINQKQKDRHILQFNQPETVLTKTNPTYTIKLKSNKTTGYSWFVIS